jgi:hypothetical protein
MTSSEKGEAACVESTVALSPDSKERRTGLYRNAEEAHIFRTMDIYLLPFLSLLYLLSFL